MIRSRSCPSNDKVLGHGILRQKSGDCRHQFSLAIACFRGKQHPILLAQAQSGIEARGLFGLLVVGQLVPLGIDDDKGAAPAPEPFDQLSVLGLQEMPNVDEHHHAAQGWAGGQVL